RLEEVLTESIPADVPERHRLIEDVKRIVVVLGERRAKYRERQPPIVNLISSVEIARFVQTGYVGTTRLSEKVVHERQTIAAQEVGHFASLIESEPIGVQVGVVTDIVPHAGFQIFRQSDRQVLSISPFRLGEHPNVRIGMAMITSAPEALALHHK